MTETQATRPRPPRVLAILLVVVGAVLAIPGLYLLTLGGSPYYLVAGVLTAISGVLLWRSDRRGVLVYALVLAGTVAWAWWESGLDGWALLPRVVGPVALGVWLALPSTRRRLGGGAGWFPALVAVIAVGLPVALLFQPRDPASAARAPLAIAASPSDADWPEYGRDKAGTRFSPLALLTPANVNGLEPAWTYRTGVPANLRVSLEVTPLKIGDRLYLCTGNNDVIALDAETGRQIWRFRANVDPTGLFAGTCRGVAHYSVPDATGRCADRIITATVDRRLLALDTATGTPCPGFGKNGAVSLDTGMGLIEPGYYHVTSAPQIIRGRVVLGGWVTDGQRVGEPSGVIRAFDAVSGKFAWAWDMGRPGRHDEPQAPETYTRGTPNSWAPISADETLGLVYLPTGNATPDYYGGHRRAFDDRYSSSVVALDAATGEPRWSFQTTHHDLWDYDVPAQPTLVDLPDGTPGLIQATKRGEVFLLDRRTGKPLATVEERAVPQGAVAGERLSPTQPFSTGMPSFAGPMPTEARMWGITPFDQLWCRIKFRQARFEGTMTPVGLDRPTLTFPGYLGGMDWGGVSVDTDRGLMIVNTNRVGNYNQLLPRAVADRMGIKPISASHSGDVGGPVAQAGTPYAVSVKPFLSPLVMPCTQPPYGMISAVDLKTRRVLWTKPFGSGVDSGPLTIRSRLPIGMGVPSIGGPVTTRGGLTFIAASQDNFLRAYETATGRELWKGRLPAGGQATPMTYRSARSGRQFVVIAAGGHGGLLTTPGDTIVAYALPR